MHVTNIQPSPAMSHVFFNVALLSGYHTLLLLWKTQVQIPNWPGLQEFINSS